MTWLANATLATSGIDYRQWQINGRTLHHIIDPRRGRPARTNLVSASIFARRAVEAEAWAKAAIILGEAHALRELAKHNYAAILVRRDGYIRTTPNVQIENGIVQSVRDGR
jgi:thiamine biosynthesis lipoprotein